jgi:cell wall-associated NlpC family hydrolase
VSTTALLGFGAATGAAPRTSSEVVAAEAARAVSALDRWERTQNPADYVRFVRARDLAAEFTADELELDADELRDAWSAIAEPKQHAVLAAMSQLGVPYRHHASEEGVGFDCSGLTHYAFGDAGVDLARVSRDQIADADAVERERAEPGDLVYYPGHIGIYLGADHYVHSPNSGNDVVASPLPDRSLRFGDAVPEPLELLVDRSAPVAE